MAPVWPLSAGFLLGGRRQVPTNPHGLMPISGGVSGRDLVLTRSGPRLTLDQLSKWCSMWSGVLTASGARGPYLGGADEHRPRVLLHHDEILRGVSQLTCKSRPQGPSESCFSKSQTGRRWTLLPSNPEGLADVKTELQDKTPAKRHFM